MAEVKTYKCDICGDVYHVDEERVDSMHIICESRAKDEGSVTCYEHICPDCRETILVCIDDPKIIVKTRREIAKADIFIDKIQFVIETLRDKVCGFDISPHLTSLNYRETYFEKLSSQIEKMYDKMESSRNIWKIVALSLLGLIIGSIIAQFVI